MKNKSTAVGKRIRFFRKWLGITQRYLDRRIGFPETYAEIHIAQFESGTRIPKSYQLQRIADVLDVSPQALSVQIGDNMDFMHTLFAMEDVFWPDDKRFSEWFGMMYAWLQHYIKLQDGQIKQPDCIKTAYRWQAIRRFYV